MKKNKCPFAVDRGPPSNKTQIKISEGKVHKRRVRLKRRKMWGKKNVRGKSGGLQPFAAPAGGNNQAVGGGLFIKKKGPRWKKRKNQKRGRWDPQSA